MLDLISRYEYVRQLESEKESFKNFPRNGHFNEGCPSWMLVES